MKGMMCLVIATHYSHWLKMYHPECNTPHHVNPSNTTSSVNSTDINPPTASLNASDKESIVLDQQEGTSTQTNLILAKKGKLHSFLEVPTSLACHSKGETRGAKVLTSQDYLEELAQKEKQKKKRKNKQNRGKDKEKRRQN